MLIKSWLALFTFFLIFQATAKAETIYTTVFNVFESIKTERILILSGVDGRIYKTFKNKENLAKMNSMVGKIVRIDYSIVRQEAIISNIQLPNSNEIDPSTLDLNHFQYNQLRTFAPTDLQSFSKANEIFSKMLNDGDKRNSECFKRAHMWAFDMWSKLGVSSEKIFIFYTKRYALLEEFEWWFHVAPMVTVAGDEYVMDGTFMQKPITVKEWKDYFIKTDKITCPIIENYQKFENNQWNRLCYLMKVPMYYFGPLDIQERDNNGEEKNHWVLEELQDARRAFKNFSEVYEGLDNGKPTHKY